MISARIRARVATRQSPRTPIEADFAFGGDLDLVADLCSLPRATYPWPFASPCSQSSSVRFVKDVPTRRYIYATIAQCMPFSPVRSSARPRRHQQGGYHECPNQRAVPGKPPQDRSKYHAISPPTVPLPVNAVIAAAVKTARGRSSRTSHEWGPKMSQQQKHSSGRWPAEMPPISVLGRELLVVTAVQRCRALLLPLVSAATLALFAALGWSVAAVLAAAAYTFYSYGSTSHDLVHGNLGLPRWLNHVLLSIVELLGLRSGHAYQAAHLHHHARFPLADDVEGAAAHGTLIAAVLAGPLQQLRIWCWAARHARRHRTWIVAEGVACLAMVLGALASWPLSAAPAAYLVLVVLGSWTFPLITGYLPHHPQGANALSQTRRFRGIVAAVLFRQHLYHLEHHLYPAVPHQHWPRLACAWTRISTAPACHPSCWGSERDS